MASWTRAQQERLTHESRILRRWFPSARWIDPGDSNRTRIEIDMTTNAGSDYLVRVVVPPDYPASQPHVLVADPWPLEGRSCDLRRSSFAMHTLKPLPIEPDLVRICHYQGWDPNLTIYLAVTKARIWLEAYEQHMETGRPIDAYLKHMDE